MSDETKAGSASSESGATSEPQQVVAWLACDRCRQCASLAFRQIGELCPCSGAFRLQTATYTTVAISAPAFSGGSEPPGQTLREMQAINADRSARWMAGSPGWTTLEIAGELAGEVGELANVCKKLRRSELGVPGNKVSDEVLIEQARGEIADVLVVLMLTASKLSIDLQDAVCDTFNAKSEQMGFPERLRSASSGPSEPTSDGRTHHATCYTTKGHHDCAIREVERLRSASILGAGSGCAPECTGIAAQWCPKCGHCTCKRSEPRAKYDCPLHGDQSKHADNEPTPSIEAQIAALPVTHVEFSGPAMSDPRVRVACVERERVLEILRAGGSPS